MLTSKYLATSRAADQAQIRITSGMALVLFLVFVVALFERAQLVNLGLTYIPFTSAFLIMSDWITAALLFAQAKALRDSPLAVLATGFFFTGLLVILRLLSVPSFVTPDPTAQIPLLFYLASHAALPVAVLPYAWLGRASNQPASLATPRHPAQRNFAGAVILMGSLILAATTVETTLQYTSPIFLTGAVVVLLTITAMVVLVHSLRSKLDLWLLLALWGWLLEVALITLESQGNTAAWYAARGLGLVSGLFVLFALIAEIGRLYGQTVDQLNAERWEQESRLLIREAAAASIAHELRQPIAAIMLKAQIGQMGARQDDQETSILFKEIEEDSRRANDTIQSTRLLFAHSPAARQASDVNELIRKSLALVSPGLKDHAVSVDLKLGESLPPVAANQLQMQELFLNLFTNAMEAMSEQVGKPRILTISSSRGDAGVVIRVQDTGPGISGEEIGQIFTPFHTTKTSGTGVGLVICQSIVSAHAGSFQVIGGNTEGATFEIYFPSDSRSVSVESGDVSSRARGRPTAMQAGDGDAWPAPVFKTRG